MQPTQARQRHAASQVDQVVADSEEPTKLLPQIYPQPKTQTDSWMSAVHISGSAPHHTVPPLQRTIRRSFCDVRHRNRVLDCVGVLEKNSNHNNIEILTKRILYVHYIQSREARRSGFLPSHGQLRSDDDGLCFLRCLAPRPRSAASARPSLFRVRLDLPELPRSKPTPQPPLAVPYPQV
jgi:hypothetical protein